MATWTVYRLDPGPGSSVIAHATDGAGQRLAVRIPRRTHTRAEIDQVVQRAGDLLIDPPQLGSQTVQEQEPTSDH